MGIYKVTLDDWYSGCCCSTQYAVEEYLDSIEAAKRFIVKKSQVFGPPVPYEEIDDRGYKPMGSADWRIEKIVVCTLDDVENKLHY